MHLPDENVCCNFGERTYEKEFHLIRIKRGQLIITKNVTWIGYSLFYWEYLSQFNTPADIKQKGQNKVSMTYIEGAAYVT